MLVGREDCREVGWAEGVGGGISCGVEGGMEGREGDADVLWMSELHT